MSHAIHWSNDYHWRPQTNMWHPQGEHANHYTETDTLYCTQGLSTHKKGSNCLLFYFQYFANRPVIKLRPTSYTGTYHSSRVRYRSHVCIVKCNSPYRTMDFSIKITKQVYFVTQCIHVSGFLYRIMMINRNGSPNRWVHRSNILPDMTLDWPENG